MWRSIFNWRCVYVLFIFWLGLWKMSYYWRAAYDGWYYSNKNWKGMLFAQIFVPLNLHLAFSLPFFKKKNIQAVFIVFLMGFWVPSSLELNFIGFLGRLWSLVQFKLLVFLGCWECFKLYAILFLGFLILVHGSFSDI